MEKIDIPTIRDENAQFPSYGSEEAAGADIRAYIQEPIVLRAKERTLVPTGIKVEIPHGFEIQVRPRSGLAYKHGIMVLNTPGTIDSDYRGEIKVILMNLGDADFVIEPNMRIAQLVLAPVTKARFIPAEALATSARGAGGFGHTGTH
ncbi:MAG: dUTP diphosphatase [Chlamydiia bacterium]|nr:dUTP diphosphatase [Chlamydiia bacterium]